VSVLGSASQKLFVVDDDDEIADLLSVVLREAGFDVETFYNARSALLRAADCPLKVLVSDITMSDMDGFTLAKSVRMKNPNCKIILISGIPYWKALSELQGGGELDGFAVLFKPISYSQLLRHIKAEQPEVQLSPSELRP
jgi:DNA-binding NtrC family response regulator